MDDVQGTSAQSKTPQYHLAIQCGNERCWQAAGGVPHWICIRPWEFETAPNFDPAQILEVKCDRCGQVSLPRASFLQVIDETNQAVILPNEESNQGAK